MRRMTALLIVLCALGIPVPALAGTFTVPFGGGTPMAAAGWVPNAQAGALCGYEGIGTLWLNAGTLPAHSGCFTLFNAPGAAQIVAVNVAHSYVKASVATALCTYSFAAQPGDTIRHCAGGSFADAIATSGANWVELGIYNEGVSAVAIATSRANNAVYASGWVTLADPTAPAVWANGPTGLQSGATALLEWSASDGESGSPAVSYAIDGGARVALRGQACSWLCGTLVNGSVALDLTALADGPHAVTVYAQSYADAGSSYGPFAFTVDRTAPAQPQIHVAADPAAATAGWWGHAPVEVTVSSATASDVWQSSLHVYGPSGQPVYTPYVAGEMTAASIPAAVLSENGTYAMEVVECDAANHCALSSRASFRWDGAAPLVPADAAAPPLGLLAARDGARLTWPPAGAAAGDSGVVGGYVATGPTAASARAAALLSTRFETGEPGVAESAVPSTAIEGAAQVCLAVRPLSGAGIAAATAGVRCAGVDEQPPELTVTGATRWSGGMQTVALTASDANGAVLTEVALDGVPVAAAGGSITVAGEGAHALHAVARDGAGNETVVERSLGVDASAPVIGSVSADFLAREIRVGVSDALAGVALAELSLNGTALETRISADGGTAIARVPAGLALDGAAVSVRVLDAATPANAALLGAGLPRRATPVLRGVGVAGEPHLVGTFATRAGGAFSVRVKPARTTRYSIAVPETQVSRALGERIAGTVGVSARIRGLSIRVRGDRLVVRARFDGRGEATRLHLLVDDVLGGRWVEGCLERGRPGVHLERSGRVWGTCRVPASARGRAWTYRLVLAAPSSTWPWRTPSSASVSLLLPF
jgi:hypothetical protein